MAKWLILLLAFVAGCSNAIISNSLKQKDQGEIVTGGLKVDPSRETTRSIIITRPGGTPTPTIKPLRYAVSHKNGQYIITAIGE
jgi:hypothetical protein